jgi:hypothetical protein
MALLNVTGYILGITTIAQPQAGSAPFLPRVSIQVQPNGPYTELRISNVEEFVAIAALIQTPGRLIFDSQSLTLEKVQP